ncbi:EamA family transporter RarD [Neisseria perflava]|uniref:EamA family transporter RarD n=1 Tax=Neisseria perflava TaxID=33053 RepID=UPI0020A0E595|nr:EamA family transporter RarD [Neisseria perflava]MCP1659113.1 chloramphenicol-sensitive protein RarD [Neisseria perflava]MCP1771390.1 chloramphenicol-sensitive protein RarD [Neisseria perflava]
MSAHRTAKGIAAAVSSNLLFAMLFLYSGWMQPMSGTDVFAWRMVAMVFALVGLMTVTRSWSAGWAFARLVGRDWRCWLLIVLPTPVFASQLWLFIWAPVNGEGLNVAMGYFLFPLAMMVAGRVFLKEKLNRLQTVAAVLACAGVACELLRSGAFSWTTVWVFGSYPLYYLLRRKLGVPALIGLLLDSLLILPFAAAYIATASSSLSVLAAHPLLWWLVALLGLNSALAMYLNLQANHLLPVALFGMLSYLEPILLFVIAVVWLGEPLQAEALAGYALIWAGLCVMVWNSWREMKRENAPSAETAVL